MCGRVGEYEPQSATPASSTSRSSPRISVIELFDSPTDQRDETVVDDIGGPSWCVRTVDDDCPAHHECHGRLYSPVVSHFSEIRPLFQALIYLPKIG